MDVLPESGARPGESEPMAVDPRWVLARRIARSAAFSKSDQLSKLLLYVCRMHLAGRDAEVNEQRIGTAVFRRSPNFDSGSDTIVRTHASRLRQKLELYFTTEGSQETLRLEIPRGGYVPRFFEEESPVPVMVLTAPSPEVQVPVPVPELLVSLPLEIKPSRKAVFTRGTLFAFVAGVLVTLAIAILALRFGHPAPILGWAAASHQTTPERRFWGGLFSDADRTLVVTGDSGLVLYQTFSRREVNLPDYISGDYRRPSVAPSASNAWEQDLPTRRYTSVADLNLALRLTHLPQWKDDRSSVVFARDLHPTDAASSNLILIGSRVANPWVSLVDSSMNFVLMPDGSGRFFFLNRHPRTGEQAAYSPSQPGSGTTDSSIYALICYRPDSSGMRKILLISGLWQSGTEAAGKYVLSDPQFAAFLAGIEHPDGTFPQFELLVQVHSVAGNAFASSIVASRVQ